MDPRCYWLALHHLPDVGPVRANRLLDRFGSPEAVLGAGEAELREVEGVGAMTRRALQGWRELVDPEAELEALEAAGLWLCTREDEDFPANLRRMHAPPILLYVRGTLEPEDRAALAVIGTRRMSRYGREVCEDIATGLARAGLTVVSGLALGVDGMAHRAALDAGGRSLAVLGNGLGSVYPAQHARLAEEVAERGALLSTMPVAARPDAGSFPARNAIIAGLALGVLVVEAGARSGTRITASQALDENRTVFAVPGDVNRVNSIGANRLIREGAQLARSADDILEDLRPQLEEILEGWQGPEDADAEPDLSLPEDAPLDETERALLEALGPELMSGDELAEAMGEACPPGGGLMAALLSLEIKGYVVQEPGLRFRRLR